jgi:hypothetical protein
MMGFGDRGSPFLRQAVGWQPTLFGGAWNRALMHLLGGTVGSGSSFLAADVLLESIKTIKRSRGDLCRCA